MMPTLKAFVSIVLYTFLVTACGSSAEPIATQTAATAIPLSTEKGTQPITTQTATTVIPTSTNESTHVVSSYASVSNSDRRQIIVGNVAEIVLVSTPVIYRVSRGSDGSVKSTSASRWESHDVSEMQVCFSFETPCQLSGNWIPFKLSPGAGIFGEASVQKFSIQVDWVGPRTLWIVTQFRDTNKTPILSVGESYQTPQLISQASLKITGVWDEATLITVQPPKVQTAIAATRTAFPITGSVEIEEGRCCIGGTEGDTIKVQVGFSATSPIGKVEEMRVRTGGVCFRETEIVDTDWESLVPSKNYPVHVAINWIGFYVSVQYRDNRGNLSPVYCDDIGVEGHPKMPTSIPAP